LFAKLDHFSCVGCVIAALFFDVHQRNYYKSDMIESAKEVRSFACCIQWLGLFSYLSDFVKV